MTLYVRDDNELRLAMGFLTAELIKSHQYNLEEKKTIYAQRFGDVPNFQVPDVDPYSSPLLKMYLPKKIEPLDGKRRLEMQEVDTGARKMKKTKH